MLDVVALLPFVLAANLDSIIQTQRCRLILSFHRLPSQSILRPEIHKVMDLLERSGGNFLHGLYTLFLFTKSDIPLVIVPSLIIAYAAAGPTDPVALFHAFLWLELHLLVFEIKNQALGIEEDRLCKPYRPFVSNRASLKYAQHIYIIALATAFCYSFYHRLQLVTLMYFFGITAHNELELAKIAVLKNILSGWGYACFAWGSMYIIGHHQPLSSTSIHAVATTFLIFSLTGHAQDFRDRSGDALMGRKTIPLIYSQRVARASVVLAMAALTYGLLRRWSPPPLVVGAITFLFLMTSVLFSVQHSEEKDRKNFMWYEMWFICAHLLPIFERYRAQNM
ncbi:integral membrane protein [Moniliophthora roreri MCA 2997]|uniref:Integral membrane protein n=1 Tax=Moniliophthora roreri (strain MCA 2997) TaxID=1381753 RepID=V2XCE2_MONRO|nr:integral membrane protein [Moniliophthora roreri MCA 2997]